MNLLSTKGPVTVSATSKIGKTKIYCACFTTRSRAYLKLVEAGWHSKLVLRIDTALRPSREDRHVSLVSANKVYSFHSRPYICACCQAP